MVNRSEMNNGAIAVPAVLVPSRVNYVFSRKENYRISDCPGYKTFIVACCATITLFSICHCHSIYLHSMTTDYIEKKKCVVF